jgi:hypothetical protein
MFPLAATYFSAATGLLKHAYKTNRKTLQQLGPILDRGGRRRPHARQRP